MIIYFFWCVIIFFLGVGVWLMDGVFIGMISGKILCNVGLVVVVVYFVVDFFLVLVYGNYGVWVVFLIFYVVCGVMLVVVYLVFE